MGLEMGGGLWEERMDRGGSTQELENQNQKTVPPGAVQCQDVLGTQLERKFVLLLLDEVNEAAEEEEKMDLMARVIWVSVFQHVLY